MSQVITMRQTVGHMRTRGFTVVELVVVMVAVAILSAIVAPLAIDAIKDARIANAQNDVNAIGKGILKFEKDLGRFPMFTTPGSGLQDADADVVRLEGPGNTPSEAVETDWTVASPTDADCTAGLCTTDTIADQLLSNTPAYSTSPQPAKPFRWRGPYLGSIDEDPWGNMYLVNIINAKRGSSDAGFVLSAGPDGQIDTPFNNSETSNLAASGDDIIFRFE